MDLTNFTVTHKQTMDIAMLAYPDLIINHNVTTAHNAIKRLEPLFGSWEPRDGYASVEDVYLSLGV